MHALTLARQRFQARMENPSTPRPVRLAHGLVASGHSRFLPVLSSSLAQDVLTRGYDARTLDRVYANLPHGDLGPVGRMADRVVLDLPIHQGLRERREAAVGEICAAAVMAIRGGEPEFRIVCAPCGLASEILGAADRLRAARPETFARLRCWGVEPDVEGNIIPEAARRARAAGISARFIREDLRRYREVSATARREGPFHLAACLGISSGRSLLETGEIIRFYAGLLAPGGTLLVDRWQPASKSKVSASLGIQIRCPATAEFNDILSGAGLVVEREHPSGEGGCVLVVARKPLELVEG